MILITLNHYIAQLNLKKLNQDQNINKIIFKCIYSKYYKLILKNLEKNLFLQNKKIIYYK